MVEMGERGRHRLRPPARSSADVPAAAARARPFGPGGLRPVRPPRAVPPLRPTAEVLGLAARGSASPVLGPVGPGSRPRWGRFRFAEVSERDWSTTVGGLRADRLRWKSVGWAWGPGGRPGGIEAGDWSRPHRPFPSLAPSASLTPYSPRPGCPVSSPLGEQAVWCKNTAPAVLGANPGECLWAGGSRVASEGMMRGLAQANNMVRLWSNPVADP
jgi:hypothetical protein